MFIHFSILMIISKAKGKKFDQNEYDNFFHNIENNLRELGFGDVTVNKKMKDFNKILYDILLKIQPDIKDKNNKKYNKKVFFKYFKEFNNQETPDYSEFETYFSRFYIFCEKLALDNMIKQVINFKY